MNGLIWPIPDPEKEKISGVVLLIKNMVVLSFSSPMNTMFLALRAKPETC